MRKWLENIDWGPLVAAALFLIFAFAVLSPSPREKPRKQGTQTESAKQDSNTPSWWNAFWDIRASDSLVAAFTGALVVVGWIQARRLRESIDSQKIDMGHYVEESKRSATAMENVAGGISTQVENMKKLMADQSNFWKRQMRPYVFVRSGSIINVADPPAGYVKSSNVQVDGSLQNRERGPIAPITIQNFGHTPAHEVKHLTSVVVREIPLRDIPFPTVGGGANAEMVTVFDLAPFTGNSTHTAAYERPLTAAEIAGLKNGTMAVYVSGEITYKDTFGDCHRATYRFRHNTFTGTVGISTELTGTSHGNYSD
jgi:hypothetical protein